jgi:L-asparaginase II
MDTSVFRGETIAEVVRAGLVESVHSGHLIELDSSGSVVKSLGSVHAPVYPRSSVKSLQASAMVRAGLKLKPEQLAVVCASHSGSEEHFRVIRSILKDHGLDESALRNAVDYPLGEPERRAWGDKEKTQLAQNCSGKHAGMLATCVVNGWDTNTYTDPQHPLQKLIVQEFETLAREKVQYLTADGCGAPLFALSIAGLAQAIHTITVSTDPVYQEVVSACRANPLMIAGEGRLTTRLMRAVPGLFMKEGAEGVEVLSMPDGRTLVIKCADGSWRPMGPIITATFKRWGVEAPDENVYIYGGGKVVGQIEAK